MACPEPQRPDDQTAKQLVRLCLPEVEVCLHDDDTEDIDIEDTMNVVVKYKMGATLSYSLNAMNAWEGYNIAFNGTKGRIEVEIPFSPRVDRPARVLVDDGRDVTVEGGAVSAGAQNYQADQDRERTRLIPLRGKAQDLEVWTGTGGHGGGDNVMLTEVFGKAEEDKYKRAADVAVIRTSVTPCSSSDRL